MTYSRPQAHECIKLILASIATKKRLLPASSASPAHCQDSPPWQKAPCSRMADGQGSDVGYI